MTSERGALPPGWVWTTLGEIQQGERRSINPTRTPDQQFELYSVPSFDFHHPEIVAGAAIGSNKQIVEPDTVLLCKINPRINRVWVVGDYSQWPKIASTEWIPFPERNEVLPAYLCNFLQTADFRDFLTLNMSGVGGSLMRARANAIEDYPFPLAPFPEQQRIVAEIEKQFTRLDTGVAALKRVQANLKRYRASVLKAACEGRLAPQDPNDEPAERLLARILAERRARWEAEHPGKKYVEPAAPETDGLAELPAGWCWVRVGAIFDVTVGGTPSRSRSEYWNGDIPWVSSGEVAFNRIRSTREQISQEGLRNSNAKLHSPGTVLLAMIGEGKTRGQAAILETAATTNQNIASLLVSETEVYPEWIFYWLESRYEQTRKSGSGGMQYALNSGRIKDFACPIPPIPKQRRIVAEVERRLSVVAELEATVAADLARAGRLRQAVLKRAFEGRLVVQDAPSAASHAHLPSANAERLSNR